MKLWGRSGPSVATPLQRSSTPAAAGAITAMLEVTWAPPCTCRHNQITHTLWRNGEGPKNQSKLQGLDLSKRREDEIGKRRRGREAVYEAEGVGSRQWHVDSGSGWIPLRAPTAMSGAERGSGFASEREPPERGFGERTAASERFSPRWGHGGQAPHETDRFPVIEGGSGGASCFRWRIHNRNRPPAASQVAPTCRCGADPPAPLEGETYGCRPRAPTSLERCAGK